MAKWILIGMSLFLVLSACSLFGLPNVAIRNGGLNHPQQGRFTSNGQQIYFTAADQSGRPISYSGGPAFGGMMMGSYLTCASCHGNDGQGGTHYMHMQVMDAPAINYTSLLETKKQDAGSAPDGFTLDDFRGAVMEGHDTAGESLNQNMPRWQMSDQDLADLLAFLKTLP